jgi:hypothetical protein
MEYQDALSNQANSVATEKLELMDEKAADLQARTELAKAKAEKEAAETEIAKLEEARAAAREPKEIELINAKIYNLRKLADAASNKARTVTGRLSRESANQMYARLLQEEVGAGRMSRDEAMSRLENAMFDPMRALLQQATGAPMAPKPTPSTKPKVFDPKTKTWK